MTDFKDMWVKSSAACARQFRGTGLASGSPGSSDTLRSGSHTAGHLAGVGESGQWFKLRNKENL